MVQEIRAEVNPHDFDVIKRDSMMSVNKNGN